MAANSRVRQIQDVLGSVHIFASGVSDFVQEQLLAITGEQLTFSQLKLLKLIAQTEAYNISQVAAFMGVSNAAASKAVDRLVRRDLLRRRESEDDRRAVQLSLTEEGRRLLEEYEVATSRTLQDVFGSVSVENLRQVAELLDRLSISLVDRDGIEPEVCFRCGIFFRDKCLLRSQSHRSCHFDLNIRTRLPKAGDGNEIGS